MSIFSTLVDGGEIIRNCNKVHSGFLLHEFLSIGVMTKFNFPSNLIISQGDLKLVYKIQQSKASNKELTPKSPDQHNYGCCLEVQNKIYSFHCIQ